MKIAAAQLTPGIDPAENLAAMRRLTERAARAGARIVVFPEQTMVLLSQVTPEQLAELAEVWWARLLDEAAALAAEFDVVVVTAGFEPAPDSLPLNTIVAVAPDGSELARYRKLHLYEAFKASEAAHTRPGTELPPVFDVERDGETLRFGLANCYDVRFPELFRSLTDRGATAFLLSAAWASGPGKEAHWRLLTQARALENVSWLVASATSGGGSDNAATVGLSRIVTPLGEVAAELPSTGDGCAEGIAIADVSAQAVEEARRALPALANRRIHLGYTLTPE